MAEENELFWPSLYSRLVPHRYGTTEAPEGDPEQITPQHFLTDFATLRRHIETDLVSLLNATCLEAALIPKDALPIVEQGDAVRVERDSLPFADYPQVQTSIVNYGLPTVIGRSVYRQRINDLEDDIKRAILSYEPRLRPETLRVRVEILETGIIDPERPISFEIEAEILGTNTPMQVYINTVWDLEKLRTTAWVER